MIKLNEYERYKENGRAPYIMINDLKPYHLYKIHARNSSLGIYLPKQYSFLIRRLKFYDWFVFEEFHWDTGALHGTVRPLKELENTPFGQEDLRQGPWETNGIKYYGYFKEEEIMNYLETKAKEYENE